MSLKDICSVFFKGIIIVNPFDSHQRTTRCKWSWKYINHKHHKKSNIISKCLVVIFHYLSLLRNKIVWRLARKTYYKLNSFIHKTNPIKIK